MSFPDGLRPVEIRGASLAYVDRGAGQPVVFVHGTGQDVRTWSEQLDAVAASYRAVAYSRRYARPNEDIASGADDPMAVHVDDLRALLHALDAAPAHLVGSSWGGFICLLTAIGTPALVRTLTLLEPPVLPLFISNNPTPGEIARLFLRRPVDALRVARFGLGVIEPASKAYRKGEIDKGEEIFGRGLLGKRRLAAMPANRAQMLAENKAVSVAQMLGEGFPPVTSEQIRSIQHPTLLVAGEHGPPVLSKTVLNELYRLLPNARRTVIPGASHIMHEENPAAFNAALIGFLQGQA